MIILYAVLALVLLVIVAMSWDYVRRFFYIPTRKGTRHFKDSDNRILIYRGLNVCNYAKDSTDFIGWQTKEDFAKIKEWGFNCIRFLVFWEAIEPTRDKYDDVYLAKVYERIQWCSDLGISVLVDVHQDLFNRRFSGNGFPDWAVNDNDKNFTLRQPWNANYLEPAVIASYENFWKSEDLKAQYKRMVGKLCWELNKFENVIGIDVMNEPFPTFPDIRKFERKTLTKFYTDIKHSLVGIGSSTGRGKIFFEPWMSTSSGLPTDLMFDAEGRGVYAPHYYDPLCHEGRAYRDVNKRWMIKAVQTKVREAQIFKSPLFFGEFGIAMTTGGWDNYLIDFCNLADEYCFSWTYYSYDKARDDGFGIVGDNGSPNSNLSKLSRVYAQKIAGKFPRIRIKGKMFHLSYELSNTKGNTEIYVPCPEKVGFMTNGKYHFEGNILHYENTGARRQEIIIMTLE